MKLSYIAFGSNLNYPALQLLKAFHALSVLTSTTIIGESKIYCSEPIGPAGQDNYYNAVVSIQTTLSAHELLDCLQSIELQQDRVRSVKWGPRTVDLDILWYDDRVIQTERLTIPHQEIMHRSFVVYPLLSLDVNWVLSGESLQEIARTLDANSLFVIAENFKDLAQIVSES
ncbi:MAG: 2-amino-4-hydroxy-6-hydroxymethyldihydropteridine diphosphokinase [Endozoicomonadaceae bacterium]|nr:2-amino-4-hydroxy-6-hydroxymethyldihydropteridine diphosphokinase [Endozoicomonadaceae bacterium]